MKTYLSDHARLVEIENKIKEFEASLYPDIVPSDPVTLPLNQTLGKVGDFAYTVDEILQAMSLWREPDTLSDHTPRKVIELVNQFNIKEHCSRKSRKKGMFGYKRGG